MSTPHVPLSILDLVPLSEGQDAREGIEVSMRAAQAADRAGYHRYWYAEHHNTESLASNATSLLIDRAASLTERIRVGSGGIMLPNHSPLAVIEQFGTLVQFHGDRIDLGLGRAPGTAHYTAPLPARTSAGPRVVRRDPAPHRLPPRRRRAVGRPRPAPRRPDRPGPGARARHRPVHGAAAGPHLRGAGRVHRRRRADARLVSAGCAPQAQVDP